MKIATSHVNKILLFIVLAGTFCLILYKALFIPITHDEVATLYLVRDSSFSDILFYTNPDQNNHILNSLLTKISIQIFDIHLWSIRLPNLLFFSFFSIGVWRIVKEIYGFKSYFAVAAGLIFVANPYMLDFLSLSRGYGMSVGLATFSLSYLISFYKHKNLKYAHFTLIAACLASYANFTLIYFLAAILIMITLGIYLYRKEFKGILLKNILALVFFLLGYIALITIPLSVIFSTNQMIYWESDGFIQNTLHPLIVNSLSGSQRIIFTNTYLVAAGVIILFIIGNAFVIKNLFQLKKHALLFTNPLFIFNMHP